MKNIVSLAFCFLFLMDVYAQHYQFSGKVLNQENIPLEFSEVTLLRKDTIPAAHATTDSLGSFILSLERGTYTMRIEQFGEKRYEQEVVVTGDTSLGVITVNNTMDLQDVVIEGRRNLVERKVDRLVFNVENSTAASGGDALDALKATPLVRVQDETVSIVGKGVVLVMIDGRLQRLSAGDLAGLLKSIPSDNIKSIEVITTPPAQYDAEGNSGLINIKLKRAKADSWNANAGINFRQKTYAGGSVQGMFHYNHNRVSLQLSLHAGSQQYRSTGESRVFYPLETWRLQATDESRTNGFSPGLGMDYRISSGWTTGIKYFGNFTTESSANNPLTTRINPETGLINAYVSSAVQANNKPWINSFNWFNTFQVDSSGTSINTDFDYFNYRKKDYRFFRGNELNHQEEILPATFFSSTNTNVNRVENYSGKTDVTVPMGWASLSFGGKFSYTKTDNDLSVFNNETGAPVFNTTLSNLFRYKEYNEALYFSLSKKINEKWDAQAGLRMEATQTEGYSQSMEQTNRNNYLKLFPTAYLTYKPDDKQSFSLNYSKRISRPDFDYLNPFLIRTNPYYYSEGNPFLQPAVMNNLEFSYINKQNWVSSLYYAQVSDFAQTISILDEQTNITRNTPLNYANTYQTGISSYYNFNQLQWWSSFTGFNANYQKVKSKTAFVGSIDGYNAYFYSNNDFTLNKSKTAFFSLNYGLQFAGRYQIFHISTMHMLDVALKFLFFEKNLTLVVTGQDLLNGQRPLITYQSNGINNDVRNYNDTRGLKIALSYKFGNNNLKSKQRNFGNEEEQGRVKQPG